MCDEHFIAATVRWGKGSRTLLFFSFLQLQLKPIWLWNARIGRTCRPSEGGGFTRRKSLPRGAAGQWNDDRTMWLRQAAVTSHTLSCPIASHGGLPSHRAASANVSHAGAGKSSQRRRRPRGDRATFAASPAPLPVRLRDGSATNARVVLIELKTPSTIPPHLGPSSAKYEREYRGRSLKSTQCSEGRSTEKLYSAAVADAPSLVVDARDAARHSPAIAEKRLRRQSTRLCGAQTA